MAIFDNEFYEKLRLKDEELARKNAEKNTLSQEEARQKDLLCQYIREALDEFPSAAKTLGTKAQTIYMKYGKKTLFSSIERVHKPAKVWEIGTRYGYHEFSEDGPNCVGYYIDEQGTIYENSFSKASFGNEIRRVVPKEEAVVGIYNVIKACQKLPDSSYYSIYKLSDKPGKEREIVQQYFLRALNYNGVI